MKRKNLLLIIFLVIPFGLLAQWSTDPAVNLQVSSGTAEKALPYVATHPGGTTYVSWFSSELGGDYVPRIQKYNYLGVPQWPDNGYLISNNPSMTWITDYSLAVSYDTSAIIAFQDMRTGNNDVFIYKIGPGGSFDWGSQGIQLSATPDFEADPVLFADEDNSTWVAWPQAIDPGDSKIHLQRLLTDGAKWQNDVVLGETGFDYTWPRIVGDGQGNIILVFYKEWGPYWAPNRMILAQKYDWTGQNLWPAPVTLFNGATPVYVHPVICADGAGGAYVTWFYEKVTNHLSTFINHVDANGLVTMEANGTEVSTDANLHMEADLACDTTTHDVYVFYRETDALQNNVGLYGQRMDMDGNRLWGNGGKMFIGLSTKNVTIINVDAIPGGAVAGYFYDDFGNVTDNKARAMKVDSLGNTVWSGGFKNISSIQSSKGALTAGGFHNGQMIYAWDDNRTGTGEIFAQNILEDGSLGPVSSELAVTPDTLWFLNDIDISEGKPFTIKNNNDYSVDIQYIQEWGCPDAAVTCWYAVPGYSQFPLALAAGDSIQEIVRWTVSDNYPGTTIFDTLEIQTLSDTYRIIIAVDSTLIGVGMKQNDPVSCRVYPNPFTDRVDIDITAAAAGVADVTILDYLMRPVRVVFSGDLLQGRNTCTWDGCRDSGGKAAQGLYFIRIRTGNKDLVKKVLLAR